MFARTHFVALATLVLCAAPAWAQEGVSVPATASVALTCPDGAAFDWDAIQRLLRIELLGMGVELADPPAEALVTLAVSACSDDAEAVRVVVTRLSSGRSVEHIAPVPPAGSPRRSRTIALAAAELLRESWSGLAGPPLGELDALRTALGASDEELRASIAELRRGFEAREHDVAERGERAGAEVAQLRVEVSRLEEELASMRAGLPIPPPTLLFARLSGSAFVSGLIGLGGGELGASIALDPIRIAFGLGAGYGEAATALGTVRALDMHGWVGLHLAGTVGGVTLAAGPEVQVGWTRAEGAPDDPTTIARSAEDALLTLGLGVSLWTQAADALWFGGALRLGWALGGVDALVADTRVSSMNGPRIEVLAGAAFAP